MNIFWRLTGRTLRKNKVRTLVTIIGIVLSTTLFTAVTTGVSSCIQFIQEVVEEQSGNWHVKTYGVSSKEQQEWEKRKEIRQYATWGDVAYAKLPKVEMEDMPYLYISAYSGDFTELLSVRLTEGRLPTNSSELILPKYVNLRGKLDIRTGDTLTLETGMRKDKKTGKTWWQDYPYEQGERFESKGEKTYHVVGFYESASYGYWGQADSFLSMKTAGYAALTKEDAAITSNHCMSYFSLTDTKDCDDFVANLKKSVQKKQEKDTYFIEQNDRYLNIKKGSFNNSVKQLLLVAMVVLIAVVMFGSVALIYNAFSISVNERKKQYGILASVGASKRQLRGMVLFEAGVVSLIGIPLGVGLGIGGLSVTFYALRDEFRAFLSSGVSIHMSAAVWAVILAAVLAYLTVLISAYIPAKRAMKVSVVEVIRQNEEVAIKPKKIKTSRLTGRLFGAEGIIASKNFKRNRRKYRATVISLFMSIVLFVCVNTFCDYMAESLKEMMETYDCDIYVRDGMTDRGVGDGKVYDTLQKVSGITKSSHYFSYCNLPIMTKAKYVNEKTYEAENAEKLPEEKDSAVLCQRNCFLFVEDSAYRKFLQEQNIDENTYMNADSLTGIVYDHTVHWDTDKERYVESHMWEEVPSEVTCYIPKTEKEVKQVTGDEFSFSPEMTFFTKNEKEGTYLAEADKTDEEGNVIKSKWIPMEQLYTKKNIALGEKVEELPFGLGSEKNSVFLILLPQSKMGQFVDVTAPLIPGDIDEVMTFNSSASDVSMEEIWNELDSVEGNFSVIDISQQYRVNRAIMKIMRVCSLGFTLLISLIAVANVFHTISTNMLLRRREFAMLRSMGLTQRGFYRMMNYECLLYGIKSLAWGLLVSLPAVYLIWHQLNTTLVFKFYIPWHLIFISVTGVFSIVFITMFYAAQKIRKDNIVETLKQENF